jgi:hypothetical protein
MIVSSIGVLVLLGVVVGGLAFSILTAVLAKLSGEELSGWLPVWTNRLLEAAVSIVPVEYRERYRCEWRAELAAFRDRRVSALAFAWRLRRRARSVNAALLEDERIVRTIEAEPPVGVKPLDPQAVAAIVRRAVEKTRSSKPWAGEDALEDLMDALSSLGIEELPAEITKRYLDSVRDWRQQERSIRAAGEIDWRANNLPGLGKRSPRDIAEDAAKRQEASEMRRRLARRRLFRR